MPSLRGSWPTESVTIVIVHIWAMHLALFCDPSLQEGRCRNRHVIGPSVFWIKRKSVEIKVEIAGEQFVEMLVKIKSRRRYRRGPLRGRMRAGLLRRMSM